MTELSGRTARAALRLAALSEELGWSFFAYIDEKKAYYRFIDGKAVPATLPDKVLETVKNGENVRAVMKTSTGRAYLNSFRVAAMTVLIPDDKEGTRLSRFITELALMAEGKSGTDEELKSELEYKNAEVEELRRQLKEADEQIKEFAASAPGADILENISELEQEVMAKDAEIDELKNQLKSQAGSRAESEDSQPSDTSELEQELMAKDAEIDELANQVKKLKKSLSEYSEKCSRDVKDCRKKNEDYEKIIAGLKKKVEGLSAVNKKLEKKLADAQMSGDYRSSMDSKQKADSAGKDVEAMQKKIKQLKNIIDETVAELRQIIDETVGNEGELKLVKLSVKEVCEKVTEDVKKID